MALPCRQCKYLNPCPLPGNAHIGCKYKWKGMPKEGPGQSAMDILASVGRGPASTPPTDPDAPVCKYQRAINNGWWMFPRLYDPQWGPNECAKFDVKDDAAPADKPKTAKKKGGK